MSINPGQRHTRARPCAVCGGWDLMPRHRGVRCFGFDSDDGRWCHCTREEYAGHLEMHAENATYAHRVHGPCACGAEHGAMPAPVMVAHDSRIQRERRPVQRGSLVCTYVYHDPAGRPLHRTLRYRDPKSFAQQRYEAGTWRWGLGDTEPVLYRLPALVQASPHEPVWLCEGEQDADRLAGLGLVATTNPMGAKSWRECYNRWLRGRHVVVLEDNDQAGRERVRLVVDALKSVAVRLQVIEFRDLPDGADVSDWLDAGGSAAELRWSVSPRVLERVG